MSSAEGQGVPRAGEGRERAARFSGAEASARRG